MDEKYAEFLGIMAGDGCLSKTARGLHYVYVSSNSKTDSEHMAHIQQLFKLVFNKDTALHKRNDENTVVLKFSDKKIFDELSKYIPIGRKYDKLIVPEDVKKSPKLMTAFIRGLFDTDGNVTLSKQHRNYHYYPRLEIRGIARTFLSDILEQLRFFGFYGSLSKGYQNSYRLEIPGFNNLVLWQKLIGSNNPKQKIKIKNALRENL